MMTSAMGSLLTAVWIFVETCPILWNCFSAPSGRTLAMEGGDMGGNPPERLKTNVPLQIKKQVVTFLAIADLIHDLSTHPMHSAKKRERTHLTSQSGFQRKELL